MFANDPLKLRHDMQLSNWQLNPSHAPETFASAKAKGAQPMGFAKPAARARQKPAARRHAKLRLRRQRCADKTPESCDETHPFPIRKPAASRALAVVAVAVATLVPATQALAWASANRAGGFTSHSFGETSHSNAFGGSTTHVAGEGTEHTNTYGGSTAHSEYGGTKHPTCTAAAPAGARWRVPSPHLHGATAYHPPGYGAYPVYHPPAYVPAYSTGCYGCAAAAGAVVGVATGAAIASANTAAASTNAYAAGVAAGSTSTGAAYSSGYAAGAVAASAPPPGATVTTVTTTTTSYAMGVSYAALPAGSMAVTKNGTTYYLAGNTWFQPMFGANGVRTWWSGALTLASIQRYFSGEGKIARKSELQPFCPRPCLPRAASRRGPAHRSGQATR
ncbi:MAG: hypothetical protein IPP21_09910 [Betaproteobacteria bacterium]|nr:hypothetical protein [Betaproteobacteria bacterium]